MKHHRPRICLLLECLARKSYASFQEYLVWYNNLDVGLFVEAVQKMFEFYQEKKLDIFKDWISVPGLVMKYLFAGLDSNTYFSLFKEQDKDLYYTFKQNIVSGPSIIFHRYHEKDKTYVRGGKACKKIWGADANALYLWALAQKMPTKYYVRRHKENDFKRQEYFNKLSIEWLDYIMHRDGRNIAHAHNSTTEQRIGPYLIDGTDMQNRVLYEYNGCYWHGHKCPLNQNDFNDKCSVPMTTLNVRAKTVFRRTRLHRYFYVGM